MNDSKVPSWAKEMNREADGLEWADRCGWHRGVADTLAAFRELRAKYEELQLVVPTFAADLDALLQSLAPLVGGQK